MLTEIWNIHPPDVTQEYKIVLTAAQIHHVIPNLVFNFLKYYRRPRTPLIRLSVCPSVRLSVRLSQKMSQNQPEGSNNRLAKAGGRRPDDFASRPGRLLCWSSSAKTKFGPTCFGTSSIYYDQKHIHTRKQIFLGLRKRLSIFTYCT